MRTEQFTIVEPMEPTAARGWEFQKGCLGPEWKQRLCLWVIRRAIAYLRHLGWGRPMKYTTIAYQPGELVTAIGLQWMNLLGQNHPPPKEVLIGSVTFAEMMKTEPVSVPTQLYVKGTLLGGGWQQQGYPSIHGMTVTIVPWMRGFVIVPLKKGER